MNFRTVSGGLRRCFAGISRAAAAVVDWGPAISGAEVGEKTPYFHRIVVSDVPAMRAALEAIGFVAEDAAGHSVIAERLGDGAPPARLRNPATGQVIELFRGNGDEGFDRPAQGDTTIGVPVQGDPAALYEAMRAAAPGITFAAAKDAGREKGVVFRADGQRFILTSKREPFTVVHYNTADWPAAERFYEDVLGYCYFALPNRGDVVRTRLENAGSRVDIEVSDATPRADPGDRRYAGASGFRLVNPKVRLAARRLPRTPGAAWLMEPHDGTGEAVGPLGELLDIVYTPEANEE